MRGLGFDFATRRAKGGLARCQNSRCSHDPIDSEGYLMTPARRCSTSPRHSYQGPACAQAWRDLRLGWLSWGTFSRLWLGRSKGELVAILVVGREFSGLIW